VTRAPAASSNAPIKKKPAQLVVAAFLVIGVKRLNYENILATDAGQWPRLMLAILKLTFLVQAGLSKPPAHLFAKGAAAVRHEKLQLVVYHRKLGLGFFNHGTLLRLSPNSIDDYHSGGRLTRSDFFRSLA
jgi:hypothetical protein